MTRREAWTALLAVASLALPLAVPAFVPLERLPPGVAYAVTGGRWLIVVGLVFTALLALAEAWTWRPRWSALRPYAGARRAPLAAAAAGFLVFSLAVPGHRWSAERFPGDEPKYLRMAESLHRDLDVDVGSTSSEPFGLATLRRNLRGVRFALQDALRGVVRPAPADDAAHEWRAGHWTVAGRHGGSYPVHGAGLPLLLQPARLLQPFVDPARPWSLALVTLGLFYAMGLVGTARLAAAVSGSRGAGLVAAGLTFASAPLLVGGHHVYPEAAAVALVPWLALVLARPGDAPSIDRQRAGGAELRSDPGGARAATDTRHVMTLRSGADAGSDRALLLGLACGFLPWLHVKLLPLAAVFGALLVGRTWGRPRALAVGLAGAALFVLPLLLYTHHATGLWRPDAFYLRYGGEAHIGLGDLLGLRPLNGLATALVGAYDGLLVMAPIAIAGLLAVPLHVRHDRRTAVTLGALCVSVWFTAALHDGGAPGPPGRLLAPVLPLLAAPLAVSFVQLGGRLSWRFTVGLLALVTLAITLTQAGSWRRVADPYEDMFATPAVAFVRGLPDGPRQPGEPHPSTERGRELLRATLPLAAIAFWSWGFARAARRPPPLAPAYRLAWRFQAAAWLTLVTIATLARALR